MARQSQAGEGKRGGGNRLKRGEDQDRLHGLCIANSAVEDRHKGLLERGTRSGRPWGVRGEIGRG